MHRREFLKRTVTGGSCLWLWGGALASGIPAPLRASPDRSRDRFSFGLISDTHIYQNPKHPNLRHALSQISSFNGWPRELEFIVHGGDCVNYGQSEGEWRGFLEAMKGSRAPMLLAPGNHDVDPTSEDPLGNFVDFGRQLDERVESRPYAFEGGGWRFVVIPYTGKGNRAQTSQLAWLSDDLERNTSRPTAVFYHPHLFPIGIGIEYYCSRQRVKRGFIELLAAHSHVRYLFHGHVHNGLRTTQKLAWHYRGLSSIVLPTVAASRPFGEKLSPEWTSPAALVVETEGDDLRFRGVPSTTANAPLPVVDVPIESREFRPEDHPLLWGTVADLEVRSSDPGNNLLDRAREDWRYVPDHGELPPYERRPGSATLRAYGRGQFGTGGGPDFISLFTRVAASPDRERLVVGFTLEDVRGGNVADGPWQRRIDAPTRVEPRFSESPEGPVFWVQMSGLKGGEIVGSAVRVFTPRGGSSEWFVGQVRRGTGGNFEFPRPLRPALLPEPGVRTEVEIPYRELLADAAGRPDTLFLALGVGTTNLEGEHVTAVVDDWRLA